jgi:hypothetical protein
MAKPTNVAPPVARSELRTRTALQLEWIALRHQIAVLERISHAGVSWWAIFGGLSFIPERDAVQMKYVPNRVAKSRGNRASKKSTVEERRTIAFY